MVSSVIQLGDVSSLLGMVLGVAASRTASGTALGTASYSRLGAKAGKRYKLDSKDSISKGIEIADWWSSIMSKGNS